VARVDWAEVAIERHIGHRGIAHWCCDTIDRLPIRRQWNDSRDWDDSWLMDEMDRESNRSRIHISAVIEWCNSLKSMDGPVYHAIEGVYGQSGLTLSKWVIWITFSCRITVREGISESFSRDFCCPAFGHRMWISSSISLLTETSFSYYS
jgi:hypothetical protein